MISTYLTNLLQSIMAIRQYIVNHDGTKPLIFILSTLYFFALTSCSAGLIPMKFSSYYKPQKTTSLLPLSFDFLRMKHLLCEPTPSSLNCESHILVYSHHSEWFHSSWFCYTPFPLSRLRWFPNFNHITGIPMCFVASQSTLRVTAIFHEKSPWHICFTLLY